MQKERTCKHCGKVFVPKNNKQTYCDPICRIEHNKAILLNKRKEEGTERSCKPYRKVKKTNQSLRDIDAEAKAAGMTYGKYVAKMGL